MESQMNEKQINIIDTIEKEELINFLYEVEDDFIPRLTDRFSIPYYAHKLITNARFFAAVSDSSIIGVIAFYCNDVNNQLVYCSILALTEKYRKLGIGSRLLNKMIEFARNTGFERVEIESLEGSFIQYFYQNYGFKTFEKGSGRGLNRFSVKLRLWLGNLDSCCYIKQTPLEHLNNISRDTGINIFIKRDDLFSESGGGNKSRKLHYILNKAEKEGYNAIVTAGSNQSNHLRSAALNAAKSGWKAIMVIHDTKPGKFTGNLKIVDLTGAELRFVSRAQVKETMEKAMEDLRIEGFKPLYIMGGGHCVEGSFAYYEAVKELKKQTGNIKPDFIVVPSGTGTTQAGLEIGVRQIYPGCKVLGVSVSKEAKKGKTTIIESMTELNNFLDHPIEIPDDIFFDDRWIGEGYRSTYPEMLETINWTAKNEGLLLDPTYTGKAFHALRKYAESGEIPAGSKVIFWHTGGLLNFLVSDKI